MYKILETTVSLLRKELLESQNSQIRLRISMRTATQDQVEAINAHLDLLPGPRKLEDILEEHET